MTKTNTATPSTAPKRITTKSTASTLKTRTRVAKESPLPEPIVPPVLDLLAVVTERLNALEEKIVGGLSSVTAEIHTLKITAPEPPVPDGPATTDAFLSVVADLIRRNLMEQMNPVIASLKRLEERVGFMSNRLKQPPPTAGPDHRQQKPWRNDQQQRHNRPRGPRPGGGGGSGSGSSSPPQGQTWTPPSAASVQGHFAPRPLRGGESGIPRDDDE
ncbi:MAG: hypothetical protein EXR78_03100 [Deltaproteobacteria bacterium]|nr:hypothetical protein [Deltaproteobacteria bacterium]